VCALFKEDISKFIRTIFSKIKVRVASAAENDQNQQRCVDGKKQCVNEPFCPSHPAPNAIKSPSFVAPQVSTAERANVGYTVCATELAQGNVVWQLFAVFPAPRLYLAFARLDASVPAPVELCVTIW
jgi:hypothetical protein